MATVIGDIELKAALRGISARTSAGFDPLLKTSLEPLLLATRVNAFALRQPFTVKGGHLDQGVVIAKVTGSSTGYGVRSFWVTFTGRARKLAHLVEFGTAPHFQPKRNRMHPGARAKPFFTPAFESKKDAVVTRVAEGAWALVEAAALSFGRGKQR